MSGTTTVTTPAADQEPRWAKPGIGVYSLTLLAGSLIVAWLTKNDTAMNLLIGAVIAMGNTVVQFYFGSSSGSAKKTDLLSAAQPISGGIPPTTPSVVHTETVSSSTATPVPTPSPTPRPTPSPTPGPLTP